MCFPNLFDKDGLTQELVGNLKEGKLKLIRKRSVSSDFMDKPLPTFNILWCQNTQGKGRNKGEKLLSLNNLPSFIHNGCVVCTIEMGEGTWAQLRPLWKMLTKIGLSCWIKGWKVVMVVLFGGKPTQSDQTTIQILHWCTVVYSDSITSQVVPFIEMIYKQVEVWMEDTSVAPPYKYTDLRREIFALLVEIVKDNSWHGKDTFAFDAVVPVCSGIHVGDVTVTFWSDCAYSASLSKKIGKLPTVW
jgi:hypothetical protein